ncbi:unnamed protein product [Bursaphelenchus xylophilus]|uniref:(pine wood nematode) hypothetical protein n=1 Tax=Bursaphelenchus xylophilus TaxID=6326 RepID=A0A1I7SF78_BURXY|nr:unnamed protein product [Bursaphelenchus xylophilus]CAG9130488.1 unnamed protein product [Bursaphelenchus xylophilus]
MIGENTQNQEITQLKSRLTDVEGRLACYILEALQKQARCDIKFMNRVADDQVPHSFYSLVSVAVFISSHGVAISFLLYQLLRLWYFYLVPISNVMNVLFKDNFVLEPFLIILLFNVLRIIMTVLTGFICIMYLIGFFVLWQGNARRYSIVFGISRILNSLFLMTLGSLVVLLQIKDGAARSLIGHIALHGIDDNRINSYDVIQYELGCCGFYTYNDWHYNRLFNWSDPMSGDRFEVINRHEYRIRCTQQNIDCSVPESCCLSYNPSTLSSSPLTCHHPNQKDLHKYGCVHVLDSALFNLWITSLFTLIYSLIVMMITAFLSSGIICETDGLGVVDPISELPVSKLKGVKLIAGLDSPASKHSIFSMKPIKNKNSQDEILQDALQGKRNHHLDPEDSTDSDPDVDKDASYMSLGL